MKTFDLVQDSTGTVLKEGLFHDDQVAKETFLSELGYDLNPKLDDENVKEFTLINNDEDYHSFLSQHYETALQEALTILGYSVYQN
jgi:hypothetical protein